MTLQYYRLGLLCFLALLTNAAVAEDTFHPQMSNEESLSILSELATPPNCTEWNAENRLECWLWGLQVDIPPQSFTKDWITIKIRSMVCSQFHLEKVATDYKSPEVLELSVNEVAATCKGNYHASGGLSGHVKASIRQQDDLNALEVAFRLSPSRQYTVVRPYMFNTTMCQTHLKGEHIHFSGSTSAKLIQTFSKTISHYVTDALQEYLCPLLHQQLDPLATNYLHQFDHWMQPYLPDNLPNHTFSTSPEVTMSRGLLAQNDVSGIELSESVSNNTNSSNPMEWNLPHWALDFVNNQLENHLQTGWLIKPPSTCSGPCKDMFRGFSGWFEAIWGSRVRVPLPPFLQNISLPALPMGAEGSLGLKNGIIITGLDQLDTLQLLSPAHDHLQSSVYTQQGFYIEAPLDLHLRTMGRNASTLSQEHDLEEPFTVKFNVTNLQTLMNASLQVLDWESTTLLQVVDAVQRFTEHPTVDNIQPTLGCLIRTLDQPEIVDWLISGIIESVTIERRINRRSQRSNILEEDLDAIINRVLELFIGEYNELWSLLGSGLVNGPGRDAINQYADSWLNHQSTNSSCPVVPTSDEPKWLNFTKFDLLKQFNSWLNSHEVLNSMNLYFECMGQFLEALVDSSDIDLFAIATGTDSTYSGELISILGIETKSWGTMESFNLLNPKDETTLSTSIGWGDSNNTPQVTIFLELDIGGVSGEVNVTAYTALDALIDTKLDFNLNTLQNLTVARFLQEVRCAILPVVELRFLPESVVSFGDIIGVDVSAELNNRSIHLSTTDYDDNFVSRVAEEFLDESVGWIRSLSNKALEEWVIRSPGQCPGVVPRSDKHGQAVDPNSIKSWVEYPLTWIVFVVLVLAQGGVVLIAQGEQQPEDVEEESEEPEEPNVRLRESLTRDVLLEPVPLEDDIQDALLNDMRALDQSLMNDIREGISEERDDFVFEGHDYAMEETDRGSSLLGSTHIADLSRFAIPTLIVGTIVLLFSSNTSVGASVDLTISVAGNSFQLPGLFEFSLGNTVTELYKAGIYPLLLLVVVFSGIWPYAKLLWMFYAWIANYQDIHLREERLLMLDALSKFSLVDTYVLVVMLVAFRFHLNAADDLNLDVYVTPVFGFYSFLLATCLSLVLGHGMLFAHRLAQRRKLQRVDPDPYLEQSIFDHGFSVLVDGPHLRLSRMFQVLFFSCCLAALTLLAVGFSKQSFSFEFGGLAGMALGDKKEATYSLLSLGLAIPQSVENPTSVAVFFLQLAYYFYAVVTPITCLVLLMALLMYPMTLPMQRNVLVAAEIANAWSAVEVFVLSIVAALFQISTFASFIIGDKCDLINQLAEILLGGDVIPDEDTVCFTVDASVQNDCWYLVVGVILNSIVVSMGLRLAHAAVDERQSASNGKTVAARLFHLPLGWILFSTEQPVEGIRGDSATDYDQLFEDPEEDLEDDLAEDLGEGLGEKAEGEEDEEERPEWTHWF